MFPQIGSRVFLIVCNLRSGPLPSCRQSSIIFSGASNLNSFRRSIVPPQAFRDWCFTCCQASTKAIAPKVIAMAPSRKRDSTAYASDDGFIEEDDAPSTKRSRTNDAKASKAKPSSSSAKVTSVTGAQIDDNGDPFWELSANGLRRAGVNNFKGKMMVNIREHYEKDGVKLPGKKVGHLLNI